MMGRGMEERFLGWFAFLLGERIQVILYLFIEENGGGRQNSGSDRLIIP
jgi:hypothetical protein